MTLVTCAGEDPCRYFEGVRMNALMACTGENREGDSMNSLMTYIRKNRSGILEKLL